MRKQNHQWILPGHPDRYLAGGFFILFWFSVRILRKARINDLFSRLLVSGFPELVSGDVAENSKEGGRPSVVGATDSHSYPRHRS
jgi:hypothetical protein